MKCCSQRLIPRCLKLPRSLAMGLSWNAVSTADVQVKVASADTMHCCSTGNCAICATLCSRIGSWATCTTTMQIWKLSYLHYDHAAIWCMNLVIHILYMYFDNPPEWSQIWDLHTNTCLDDRWCFLVTCQCRIQLAKKLYCSLPGKVEDMKFLFIYRRWGRSSIYASK